MDYKETIIDVVTGEVTERPYTAEEIAAAEALIAEGEAKAAAALAEAEAKETARQAVLAKLGLTAEEIAALIG